MLKANQNEPLESLLRLFFLLHCSMDLTPRTYIAMQVLSAHVVEDTIVARP